MPNASQSRHPPRARLLRLATAWSLVACWCSGALEPQQSGADVPEADPASVAASFLGFRAPDDHHPTGTRADEIRIGMVDVSADAQSASRLHGATLAVQAANRRGGVRGVPVVLHVAEAANAWSSAADRARELIYADECVGLITPPDADVSHLLAQVATRAHIPLVSLSSASSLTRVPVPWLVRAVPDTRAQLEALFAALPATPTEPIPAIVPAGRRGRGIRRDLVVVAGRLGLPPGPVIEIGARLDPTQLDALAPHRDAPILVWLPGAEAAGVLELLVAREWKGAVLLPWQAPGAAGLRCLSVSMLDISAADAPTAEFVRAYREAFGTDPDAAAATAHDAAALFIEAVREVGTSRSAIRAWLVDSAVSVGPTGPMHFDATGNRVAAWGVADARIPQTPDSTRPTATGN